MGKVDKSRDMAVLIAKCVSEEKSRSAAWKRRKKGKTREGNVCSVV